MELISREDLLKQIGIDSRGIEGSYGDTWKFLDTIRSMPAVESRVKAKWLTKTDRVWVVCSNCGKAVGDLGWTYPYCPHCTAEMEGMEREE